jgi:hypothetical protein
MNGCGRPVASSWCPYPTHGVPRCHVGILIAHLCGCSSLLGTETCGYRRGRYQTWSFRVLGMACGAQDDALLIEDVLSRERVTPVVGLLDIR